MRQLWIKLVDGLTSMKLTIACLAAALVLVFVGTMAQMNLSTDLVQQRFFESLIVWLPVEPNGGLRFPVFPGGHLIGGVLLLNLIAAHIRKFKWGWRHAGLHLTHAGLIIMMAGGLLTHLFSVESFLRLSEGQTKNYSEESGSYELAIVDQTDPQFDNVTVIPQERLQSGRVISQAGLPFSIVVQRFLQNSRLQMLKQAGPGTVAAATNAHGAQIAMSEAPRAKGMDETDMSSAVVELVPTGMADGQKVSTLGTWLVSPALETPQKFSFAGKKWDISLRQVRHYKPYSITLNKFTHERYMGTEIAKNFASSVQLNDQERGENRNVLIYMNHPLRYRGDTFYQSGFGDNDTTSILQVVHNPSAATPYVACVVVGFGLLIQFSSHLLKFSRRLAKAPIA